MFFIGAQEWSNYGKEDGFPFWDMPYTNDS